MLTRRVKKSRNLENGIPIGANFSPASKQLSVGAIQKYLRNGFLEQRVYHYGNCGRIICKEKQHGRLRLPTVDRLPQLGVVGHPLPKEEPLVSPMTDRKAKLARIIECRPLVEEKIVNVAVDLSHISEEQIDHVILRRSLNDRFGGGRRVSKMIEEIARLWHVWNRDAALCCQHINEIPKHICFDKKPPWKMKHNNDWEFLSVLLDIHNAIRKHFFNKMHNELRIEWSDFFIGDGCRSLTHFREELHRRIHCATYAARTQWPLEICQILLNHSAKWTKFLLDKSKISHFLNSIASLQAVLISITIRENYQRIVEELLLSAAVPRLRLRIDVNDRIIANGVNISALFGELFEMGKEIPEAQTKLYPRLFPDVKYVTVPVHHVPDEFIVQTPVIFEFAIQRMTQLRVDIEQYFANGYKADRWKMLMCELKDLHSEILSKRILHRQQQFLFDFSQFKKALVDDIESQMEALVDSSRLFRVDTANRVEQLFLASCAKLHNKSQMEQMVVMSEVVDVDLPQMKSLVNAINEAIFAVMDYSPLNDADMERCFYVSRLPSRLSYIAGLVWHRLCVDRTVIEKKILEQSETMHFEAEMLEKELNTAQNKYHSLNTLSELKRISHKFADICEKCTHIIVDYPALKSQLALLEAEAIRCDLPTLLHHATLFKRFSALHLEIITCEENWLSARIVDFNRLEIPEKVERLRNEFFEIHAIIEKEENETVFGLLHQKEENLEKILSKFVELLPVLTALSNDGMKEYHWQEILGDIKTSAESKSSMRLKDLIEMDIAEKAEKIEEVSAVATKERILEENVKSMQQQWAGVTLSFVPYKDTELELVLLTDQLRVLLEAHVVRTQTILGSPFVAPLMDVVHEWANILYSIDSFFSLYSTCESKWCYLEPIFASEEVAYQMPNEWRAFKDICESWIAFHRQLKKHSIIVRITSEIPMIDDTLRHLVASFERMHEGFENFLEKKRNTFPRLYFLSDSELMDLLSRARNINAMSIFLPKLFSSVRAFEFTARGEVCTLVSDSERIQLVKPVSVALAKRHVEKWLLDVEKEMKRTLRCRLREIIDELQLEIVPLSRILKRPSQLVLLYYKLSTTSAIEMALRQRSLQHLIKLLDERIVECLSLTNLPPNEGNTTRIVLLHFIQCKEIVVKLYSMDNSDLQLIEWTKELRYYWSNANVFVRLQNFLTPYQYEFISVSDITISTRHTKKIISQLVASERHGYGGLVVGPAATGKSHSVKELSRLFGRFFVAFNCSTEIPSKQIIALIKGCVLSGSTLCFDEFNRLSSHALITAISTVLSIHETIERGDGRLRIGGDELTVNTASAIHVTLNANLIGRRPLPANVNCAFRRVEVGSSDCEHIALTLLHMHNVPKYETIAHTTATLLKEGSLLLGRQTHLDFGLRAMRAIVALCIKDRESKNAVAMTVNAAQTILLPAFTSNENSTFLRILKSITKTDQIRRKDLIRNAAIAATNAKNMASEESFIEKCCQLYDLLSFRCGVIVFGESMCGKSALIDVVAEMTRTDERSTTVIRINPSLVDSKSLYGYFDADMLEWIPGIFSHILGETVLRADHIQQWIVLDGKVHTNWIESMNSLLDDNRILCLANGQTIPLRDNVRIIFETNDLKFVAATTVSRCGIVNMGPTVITTESFKLIPSSDETVGSIQLLEKVQIEMTQLKEIVNLLEIKESRRRKLLITRINTLLRIWKNVDRCKRFHTLVVYLSAQCIINNEELLKKFRMIDEALPTLFDRFPRAEVDWLDLTKSRSSSPGVVPTEFQCVLIERLLKFGNPVLLCGHSHVGKSSLWRAFCAQLDPKQWNVIVLHLSSLVDSKSLLKGILHSQLVRLGGGHYTGAEGKSVLIVLVGVNRLQVVGENSALELIRAIFERNCVAVNVTDEIRFSNVYFIGEFTTEGEQCVQIEADTRFERHWFPLWVGSHSGKVPVEVYKRIMSNYCSQFATANTELLEDVIKTEFTQAVRCSPPLLFLEEAMMSEKLLNICKDERFVVNGLQHGPLVDLFTLKADLLQKQKDVDSNASVDTVISGYSSRHIALMLKVIHSDGGHCILIGDEDLGQRDICEFVADISDCIFDSPGEEATLQQWNELILKIVRTCVADNNHHVLFIKDSLHNNDMRDAAFSDLNEIINHGGLPMRIFTPEVTDELIEKIGLISSTKEMTKFEYYNKICERVSTNLHMMLCCSQNSFDAIVSEFPNFLRYSIVDHYGDWSYDDKFDIATAYLQRCTALSEDQVPLFCEQIMKVHSFMPNFGINSTGSSFLHFIKTFSFLLKRRVEAIEKHQKRYKLGLEKLVHAEQQMSSLQSELSRLQPELVRISTETSMLMSKIEQETIEVENAREVVASDENRANAAATEAQTLKSESEQELADAIPALESAVDALQTMNQRDISTLKTMRFPPQGVRLCMEAVCILLGEAPARITDPLGGARMDYWVTGQKVLSNIHFLNRIRNFDKDNVSKKTIAIIKNNYLTKDEFDPEVVRQSSVAAEGLCLWVKAIDAYHKIAEVVAPKREKLKKAELLVKRQMKQLETRRKALQGVTERLQSLSDSFSHMSQRKQELLAQIQSCEQRMNRAQRLIGALGGEKMHWDAQLAELEDELIQCRQYSLFAAIAIEYLSALSPKHRQEILDDLRSLLKVEKPFNLQMISDEKRPSENAIIIENSRRVPLILQSRGQAKPLLMELTGGRLIVVEASDKRLTAIIRDGISAGSAILIESIVESLPLHIMPFLTLRVFTSIGQQVVPVEFMPTEEVIAADLWNVLVTYVTPQLHDKSVQLREDEVRLGREIAVIEQNLLAMLANTSELDDQHAIELLSNSRKLTLQRKSTIDELNKTNEHIERAREDYRSVIDSAAHSVRIIQSLTYLLPIYRFPLDQLLRLFAKNLRLLISNGKCASPNAIADISISCFDSISTSLFEEHRYIFRFLLHSHFTDQQLANVNWRSLDIEGEKETPTFDIWKLHTVTDCYTPVALLVSRGSFPVLKQLDRLARTRRKNVQNKKTETILHVYSVTDIACVEIDPILQLGDWILFENAHLASPLNIRAVEELLLKIEKTGNLHRSFRIFFIVTLDDQPQSFLDKCQLIALEVPKKFSNFMRYYYNHGRVSEIAAALDTDAKRSQLYRLCLLHFAIRKRCEYGIHGWSKPIDVDDVELQLALSLFHELSLVEKEISFHCLRTNVLDIVYLSKIDNAFDARVFTVMCEWFFIGVNKFDDSLIEPLFPKKFHCKDVIHHIDLINSDAYILTGMHRNVEKYYRRKQLQKLAADVRAMFGNREETLEVSCSEQSSKGELKDDTEVVGNLVVQCIQRELDAYQRAHLHPKRQTYLRSLLSQPTIRSIDVSLIESPSAIISALRLEYAMKQGITFDEVTCTGCLSDPSESEQEYIQFLGCVLLGCRYDEKTDQIAELTSEDVHERLQRVWVRAERRTKVPDERITITLHDRDTLEAILPVRVNSIIPTKHWILRGVRILTFMPT